MLNRKGVAQVNKRRKLHCPNLQLNISTSLQLNSSGISTTFLTIILIISINALVITSSSQFTANKTRSGKNFVRMIFL